MAAKWWKDRDKWMPVPVPNPPRHHDTDESEPDLPGEDIGDVADDDSDEFDDVEPPDRGLEN